jgi:rhodanese-related sulfurtransferase
MTQTSVASTAAAITHFSNRLRFETDVSDVHAAMAQARDAPDPGFVLVDTRGQAAWDQGHLPGALHLPTGQIPTRAVQLIPPDTPVVTYCWGPGCNGATRAALAFARLGYEVQEMLGGYEYWVREGFPVQSGAGLTARTPDPLTAPAAAITCDC